MNALLAALPWLLPPTALQETEPAPSHAPLHPADAELFFELPQVAALHAAYREAPLLRLARDEKLLGQLLRPALGQKEGGAGALGLDPTELLRSQLSPGLVSPDLAETLLGLAGELDALSVSVAGLRTEAGAARAAYQRVEEALEELEDLRLLISAHRDQKGPLPDHLEEIWRVDKSHLADPWGYAYRYAPEPDGSFEIATLGADGAPGGQLEDGDLAPGRRDALLALALAGLRLELIADLRSAGAAERADRLLRSLGQRAEPSASSSSGEGSFTLSAEGVPPLRARVTREGQRVTLALETGGAGPAPGSQEDRGAPGDYTRLRSGFADAQGVCVWQGYLGFDAEVVESLAARVGEEPPSGALLNALEWILPLEPRAWRTQLHEGSFSKESARAAAGAPAPPLDRTFLAALPSDAAGAWAVGFDARGLLDTALKLVADSRGSVEELMREAESASGVHPDRDLAAHLGQTLFVYLEPIRAIGPPKVRAYVELEDADAFSASLEKLAAWLAERFPEELSVATKSYRGVELVTFSVFAWSALGPLQPSPTFAVVEGRLLVSLNSAHARREIKRLANAAEEAASSERHALFELEELRRPGLASLSYVDWPGLVGSAYELLRSAAGLLGGLSGAEIDLGSLPPAEAITRYLQPGFSVTTRADGTISTRGCTWYGPEIALLPVAAASLARAAVAPAPEPAPSPPTAGEAGASVPVDAQAAQTTRERLRLLRTGLAVYKMEHGALPASLDQLLEATADFPTGFLQGASEVPPDGWGRPFVYRVEGGGVYFLYSMGHDGVDDGGRDDDVSLG